jgi:DNA-binding CsgD family transcriptional regulator
MDDEVWSPDRGDLLARGPQQARLLALLEGARSGNGGALVLRGAPGSGRSALLGWTAAAAHRPDPSALVLKTAGVSAESGLEAAGLHRLLRPVADQVALLEAENDVLRQILGAVGSATPLTALALRAAVLEILLEAAAVGDGAGRPRPLVVLVDDADRLDEVSRQCLAFAARRLEGRPIAMVFAAGPAHHPGPAQQPGPLDDLPGLALDPLDDLAAQALVRGRLAADPGTGSALAGNLAADELLAAITRAGHGNPLALTELAAALTSGQLAGTDRPPAGLPAGSRLLARHAELLAGIAPPSRRVLLIVAMAHQLDTGALYRAVQLAGLPVETIDGLWSRGLLNTGPEQVTLGDPLLRGVVRQLAAPGERRLVHGLLAEALQHERHRLERAWHRAATADGPDPVLAAELGGAARAAAGAGKYGAASRAMERAADLAPGSEDAAEHLVSASRTAWLGGDTTRAQSLLVRARPLAGDGRLRSVVDLLQGEIELRGGRTDRAVEALESVAEGLVDAPDGGPQGKQAVAALMRASEVMNMSGDFPRFLALAHRVAGLRRPTDTPETRLMFEHFAGISASCLGRHDEALRALRRVVELAALTHDPAALVLATVSAITLGDEVRAQTLAVRAVAEAREQRDAALLPVALEYLAFAEFWCDRHAAATSHALEGLRLGREAGQRNCVAAHLSILALLSTSAADHETALARSRAAAQEAQGRGLTRPGAMTTWALARLALAEGHGEDAEAALGAVESAGPRGIHLTVQVMATPDLIEAAVHQGHRGWAERALTTFERWAGGMHSESMMALAERSHALLSEDPDEAVERFAEALRMHDHRGLEFERARTQLLYGRALRRRRRPGAARDHLRDALQVFDRIDARPWAMSTRAELRAAGGTTAPSGTTVTDKLTPQQLQIAHLVVAGATNREVAAQLFISPRTVDHHLRNVYATLGVRSRVELTRLLA